MVVTLIVGGVLVALFALVAVIVVAHAAGFGQ